MPAIFTEMRDFKAGSISESFVQGGFVFTVIFYLSNPKRSDSRLLSSVFITYKRKIF